MKNLTHPGWIKAKGLMFLFLAAFSTAILIAEHFELRFILLFSIAVWSFCRFYYFAFYVITNYVDPNYKFFWARVICEISADEKPSSVVTPWNTKAIPSALIFP